MNALSNWGNRLALIGLVVTVGSMMLWFSQADSVTLPENRILYIVAWIAGPALGIAAWVKKAGWLGRIASLPAIVLGAFLLFTVSISEQILPPNAIQVGDTLPAFAAVDDRGELFDSEALRGHPVLIKFFRAHW